MTPTITHALLRTAALLAATLLIACGGGTEDRGAVAQPTAKALYPPVETSSHLPEGFPSDLPLYPGAKTTQGALRGDLRMATFETSASTKEVSEFYKRELLGKGWALEADVQMGGQTMVSGTKGKRTAGIMILEMKNGAQIVVTVSKG